MRVYLAFDIGTTSVKGCAFDECFHRITSVNEEYLLRYPCEHFVEVNPEAYWQSVRSAATKILDSSISAEDVASITFTTQGETMIPVGVDGHALTDAVIWLDDRAQEEAKSLSDVICQDEFYHHTGIAEISAATPLAKIMWHVHKNPMVHACVYKYLLLEDWLILRSTGRYVTEHSLLSSTGYFDIRTHRYWLKALEACGVSEEKLPSIARCGSIVGKLTEQAACETGLLEGTPVVAGAMDQVCAAVGAGNVVPGIVAENTGTCLAVTATSQKATFDPTGSVQVYTHFDDRYLLLTYNPTAAVVLKWFKDTFLEEYNAFIPEDVSIYDRMTEAAAKVPAGCGGLMLLPHFSGRLFPDPDSQMRGAFVGIGLDATRPHFIRAILESVAYMLRQSIEVMRNLGIEAKKLRSVGGASVSALWNEIKSTATGLPTSTMVENESTALGAAILGAVGVGDFASVGDVCNRFVCPERTFHPVKADITAYEAGYRRFLEVNRRLSGF